ncbi:hypothetical protein [Butyrivibrio sp. VCD2006]|nr:hypothetical protein [Butyrivibrio sp. VCD2006]
MTEKLLLSNPLLYNKQLISEGNLYFQTDEFKNLGGRAVQGEKVIL